MLAGSVRAAGKIESVKGNVQVIEPTGASAPAARYAVVRRGATVTTGRGAQAVIRFDDGGTVVLDQNTEFKLIDYRFDAGNPESSVEVIGFDTGAMRVVTGKIAAAGSTNFAVRTAKATLGARQADFSIASGSLYVSVSKGSVTASNTGGTVAFSAGQMGFVDTIWTRPAAIAASNVPAGVAASFSRFGSVALAAGGAASGAGAAAGAAAGGGAGTAAAIAAGLAGLAAAAGGGGGGSTPQH